MIARSRFIAVGLLLACVSLSAALHTCSNTLVTIDQHWYKIMNTMIFRIFAETRIHGIVLHMVPSERKRTSDHLYTCAGQQIELLHPSNFTLIRQRKTDKRSHLGIESRIKKCSFKKFKKISFKQISFKQFSFKKFSFKKFSFKKLASQKISFKHLAWAPTHLNVAALFIHSLKK